MTGPGTTRGLRCLSTPGGRIAAVAVDQRQALRSMLRGVGAEPSDGALRAFKVAVARTLQEVAPAVLVDPQYGLPAVVADPAISPRLPLMVALEESGTVPFAGGRRSTALAGWDAQRARNAGACAGKLLVYVRPDHAPSFEHALALVEATRAGCRRADLPFVLEILPYRLDDEDERTYGAAFGHHVLRLAEIGAGYAPDLLKLAWPAPAGADEPIAGALATLAALPVPWALLSAGAPFETFAERVVVAMDEGGAAGFIAGRALWQDAVGAPDVEAALRAGARVRLERLLQAIEGRGRPLPPPPSVADPDWFREP